jgi:taurine--2-oxoglutarate transaminase
MDMCVKKCYTGKHKVITRFRSYHGATYGALSLGGDNRRWPFEPGNVPGVVRVFDPYCYRCSFNKAPENCSLECVSHIEEIIQYEGPESFAAFFIEPIVGSSCCLVPPKGYMEGIKELCDRYRILLIVDEIMTGFGRTGEWFAIDHWKDVKPDMLTFAKGVSAGYIPLGGVVVSEEIADFFSDEILWCGLTLSGHPLSCTAALATIEALKEENLVERSKKLGYELKTELQKLQQKHQCVGEVRGTGLFHALELVTNKESREPLIPWNSKDTGMTSSYIKDLLWKRGLSTFFRWNLLFAAPPLNVPTKDLMQGISIIDETLTDLDQIIKK